MLLPLCRLFIGTSGGGLTCNREPIGVTFRSMLELTIEASEAALIGDTRQKEFFDLQTSPSTSVDFLKFILKFI